MRQTEPFHNLYPTSILICCMPIASGRINTLFTPQSEIMQARYTTDTATEIRPQWDLNPTLPTTSQLATDMRLH